MAICRFSDLKYSTFYTSLGRSIGSETCRAVVQEQREEKKQAINNSPRGKHEQKLLDILESFPKKWCEFIVWVFSKFCCNCSHLSYFLHT